MRIAVQWAMGNVCSVFWHRLLPVNSSVQPLGLARLWGKVGFNDTAGMAIIPMAHRGCIDMVSI